MPKGKPHLYKEGGLIESLRAKHDPHYKLASKVAGLQDAGEQVDKLGKEIGIKIEGIHKTLGKSFGMQRKTLQRVIGLEGRIKNLETGVEIWTNRQADRNKKQDTTISNLTDVVIRALEDIRAGKAGKAGAAGASGIGFDGSSGEDGFDGIDGLDGGAGASGSGGASGLDGLDGGAGAGGADGGADGSDGAGGISGESFLDPGNYEKFATELQQSGTIAGTQLSPQDRKEGFKISKGGLKDKKSKINFRKFLGKVASKKGKSGKSGASGAAGGFGPAGSTGKGGASSAAADVEGVSKSGDDAEIDDGEKEPGIKQVISFLNSVLDPSLTKIEENLDKILGNLEGRVEADKDKADDIKQDADAAADDAREAKLEGKGGSKIVGPAFDKAIKPVTGFLDMLLKFFTNVILGGLVMKLLKIIENPKVLLDKFFIIINGISIVLNQIIKALWFIGTAPTRILKNALEFGLNNMIDVINLALGALKSLGVDFSLPKVDFPDIPQAPQIPMIPLSSAQDAGSAPAVAMAGGGVVPGNIDKSHYGTVGYRIGQVNPPTLVVSQEKFEEKIVTKNGEIIDDQSYEKFNEMISSIGVPDLMEHQDQLIGQINKVPGYEDVNINDVIGKNVNMPLDQYLPILMNSDAQKATFAKWDAAHNMDLQSRGITDPSKGYSMYNKGGKVPGKGNTDTVPAMLTPGEFVMSKGAVDQIGVQNLMAMNKAGGGTNQPKMMKFAGGGSVPGAPGPRKKGAVTVVSGSKGPSSGGASSGSGGDQSGVSGFSAQDMMNTDMLMIKSIYNIAG